jgi:hypothetical protein
MATLAETAAKAMSPGGEKNKNNNNKKAAAAAE